MARTPRKHLLSVQQRLRDIARSIERGMPLTEVAQQFGIPLAVLRKIAAPRLRKSARTKTMDARTVESATLLIRDGLSINQAAAVLRVNISSLSDVLLRHTVTVRSLRRKDSAPRASEQMQTSCLVQRPDTEITMTTLAEAARLIEKGIRVGIVASIVGVKLSDLTSKMFRHGLKARKLRAGATAWEKKLKHSVAGERLREIANDIEGGSSLPSIASEYCVPLPLLHRAVTGRPRQQRASALVNTATLEKATKLVQDGLTVRETAALLNLKVSTLGASMRKAGKSVKRLKGVIRRNRR